MRRPPNRFRWLPAAPLLVTLVVAAGCKGSGMPIAKARTTAVADVNGQELDGATLERWLLQWPSLPDRAASNLLVSTWINTTLLVDALRHPGVLDDSALIDQVIAPDAARGVTLQYFVARNQQRPPVTDKEADSLADVDRVRIFQELVLHIPPRADSATQVALGARARALLKRAQDGADFAGLVNEASEDSVTRTRHGYLPAISRDQLDRLPRAVQAIWSLQPGEVSQILLIPPDLRIFRRARREEARPYLKEYLGPLLAGRADSLFVDSVARSKHIVIPKDARSRLRRLAVEPVAPGDTAAYATWKGGELTPALVRTSVLQVPPDQRPQLANASDSMATAFINDLARRQVVLSAISSAPMPTPEARKALVPEYRNAMGTIRAQLGALAPGKPAGAAATVYMDSVIGGQRQHLPLPGALAAVLRAPATIHVDSTAEMAVVQTVIPQWQMKHASDSTGKGSRPDSGRGAATPGGAPSH